MLLICIVLLGCYLINKHIDSNWRFVDYLEKLSKAQRGIATKQDLKAASGQGRKYYVNYRK